MKAFRSYKFWLYVAAAFFTGIVCAIDNYPYYMMGPFQGLIEFFRDTQVNHAARSVTTDVFALYIFALIWMWKASQSIGRRYFLIGFVLCTWVAAAVGLFTFLAARELVLAKRRPC